MENKIFNLDKIKELTNPIEGLQGKANYLEQIHKDFVEYEKSMTNLSYKEEYLNQIQVLTEILNQIKEDLLKISNDNITG